MTLVYCASVENDIISFLFSRPTIITLKAGVYLEKMLYEIEKIQGDIVVNLGFVNTNVISKDSLTINNEQIYDLFVRLQNIGEEKRDGR